MPRLGSADLQVIAPHIIHVRRGAQGAAAPSLMICDNLPQVACRAEPGQVDTDELKVHLADDGGLLFQTAAGRALLAELPGANSLSAQGPNQCFALFGEQGLYGLGQHPEGHFNWLGRQVDLHQANQRIAVPFLISSAGWGLLWDSCARTLFSSDKSQLSFAADAGNTLSYYLVVGPAWDRIIAGYRLLTGQVPLYGRWAYGYWQSKERYVDRDELLAIAAEYRQRQLPIDNLIQDWKYWGDLPWSSMQFDPGVFPDPKGMSDQLHRQHFHLMCSIWPVVGEGSPVFNALKEAGELFESPHWATGHIYDAFSEQGRALYWQYLKQGLVDVGVDALWIDGTEPEFVSSEEAEDNLNACLAQRDTATGPWAEVLNAYSLVHCRGLYEHLRAERPQQRVFLLSRSAFAGQQRYAGACWSGDISASWEVFQHQIPAGLNLCAAGLPYWTTDIGGFFTAGAGANFPGGCDDNAYRELYVRWFQYACFCPLMRAHGTDTPREIWRFGEPGDWAYEVLHRYLKLRYRLLPYLYSLAWQVTRRGSTLMRALPFDFSEDGNVLGIGDQFMFGPALLVAPVTEPMFHRPPHSSEDTHRLAQPVRRLYLPAGARWWHAWQGDCHPGGQWQEVAAPIEDIPLFVRAGSILPLGPHVQYHDEKPLDPLDIYIYPGADGECVLYEDSGDGYGYERGEYSEIPLHWDDAGQVLTLGSRRGEFPGLLQQRHVRCWLANGTPLDLLTPATAPQATADYVGQTFSLSL